MRLSVAPLFLAATLGCSGAEPGDSRSIGVIHPGVPGAAVIVAPDSVEAGQPVQAIINTFGSSSCTTPAGVAVRLTASTATITPYDLVATGSNTVCTRDYGPRPHPVELTFTQAGTARLVARGVTVGGTVPGKSLITVTKEIRVLPRLARPEP